MPFQGRHHVLVSIKCQQRDETYTEGRDPEIEADIDVTSCLLEDYLDVLILLFTGHQL